MSSPSLLRRFEIRRASGALRVYSAREDVNVRVSDVDDAFAAFAASAWVHGDGEPAGPAVAEITEFFEKIADGWTMGRASDYFAVAPQSSHPLAAAFEQLLGETRDVFNANAVALRATAGTAKIALAVGELGEAPRDAVVLPVVPFGAGAIVGPLRTDGRPCVACCDRTLRMHELSAAGTWSDDGAPLLALRVLETLLSKPLIPYFTSYVHFRSPLDERPVQNQALRFTDCASCLRSRSTYPPRRMRDNHDEAIAALRARGILK